MMKKTVRLSKRREGGGEGGGGGGAGLQCYSSKVVGKTEEENRRQFASEAQPC
jgi:hypothetical protein